MTKFTFIDLFAGIGGFHEAAKSLGWECVFASEIDKYACQIYQVNHGIKPQGDITKIDAKDIPDHDILFAGFPCQAFSVAGKRLGFEDTRGTLFFEIARILKEKKPNMFLLENVKGLKNHDSGKTLATILDTLKSLGYEVHWKVLNAKDYGVPQNRERIFFMGFKEPRIFAWPEPQPKVMLSQVLEDDFEKEIANTIRSDGSGIDDKHNWDTYRIYSDLRNGPNTIHSWDLIHTSNRQKYICQTILYNRRKKKYGIKDGNALSYKDIQELIPDLHSSELLSLVELNILVQKSPDLFDFHNAKASRGINGIYRIHYPNSQAFSTITATPQADMIDNGIVRRLTPRECARLQGFPDTFIIPVSNSQAYKQFGNAVCVNVVREILKSILATFA